MADGTLLRTLSGHTGWVHSVCASTDGKFVFSGSRDKTIRVWSFADGKLLHTLNGHTDEVSSVHAAADGHHLLSGSHDHT